jgi:hypothetical protein
MKMCRGSRSVSMKTDASHSAVTGVYGKTYSGLDLGDDWRSGRRTQVATAGKKIQ